MGYQRKVKFYLPSEPPASNGRGFSCFFLVCRNLFQWIQRELHVSASLGWLCQLWLVIHDPEWRDFPSSSRTTGADCTKGLWALTSQWGPDWSLYTLRKFVRLFSIRFVKFEEIAQIFTQESIGSSGSRVARKDVRSCTSWLSGKRTWACILDTMPLYVGPT